MDFQNFETFKLKSIYQPKTEISDFVKENTKEMVEYLAEQATEKMEERMRYLRQNHGATYHLRDTDWEHASTHYNERGNDIRFFSIYGSEKDNSIRMSMETHDFIYGDNGRDKIFGGWGDDVIIGGNYEYYSDEDELYGQDGNDTLFAYSGDRAYGGRGMDVLVGYGQSTLIGDGPVRDRLYSDKFVVFTDSYNPRSGTFISDMGQEDQLIINFGRGRKLGGIRPIIDNDYDTTSRAYETMVIFDDGNQSVAKIFRSDLQGFEIQVSEDSKQLVITGSEYTQRVLVTGMEFF